MSIRQKSFFILFLGAISLVASQMPPMPPSLNGKKAVHNKSVKKAAMPKECELLPPMVIFLPPPMEKQLDSCKNKLYKPSKTFAQKRLSKLLNKKIVVKSVKIVKKFSKLYKIKYNGGVLLCNDKVDACIKQ